MARRTLNRHELRAAAEAAEARGLNNQSDDRPRRSSRDPDPSKQLRDKPAARPKTRVVWAVCDMGGRTVATFDYAQKADAEAQIAALKARGKGPHFLRAVKEPMSGGSGRG
ncbi:MAG: hypothetical protein U0790_24050 [Isosphaeraceae bacterium]